MILRFFSWLGFVPKYPAPCTHQHLRITIPRLSTCTDRPAVLSTTPRTLPVRCEVEVQLTCRQCGVTWGPTTVEFTGEGTAWVGAAPAGESS